MGGLIGSSQKSTSTVQKAAVGLRFQTSAYGISWTLLFGRNRIAGNIVDFQDFLPIPHTSVQTQSGGGGKGGGSVSSSNTTYTYQVALAVGLCAGPVPSDAIKTVWVGQEIKAPFTLMNGALEQEPWAYMVSHHPDEAIGYHGLAVAVAAAFDLGDSENLGNITIEMIGLLPYGDGVQLGTVPDDILNYLWTDTLCGLGQAATVLEDWSDYRKFCLANNWLLSTYLSAQETAQTTFDRILEITNSDLVWRSGKMRIIPRGDSEVTGNGVTWTPNLSSLFSFNPEHFIVDDQGSLPLQWTDITPQDAYNHVQVEFINKDNQFNIEIAEYKDEANIEDWGLLTDPTVYSYHDITFKVMAQQCAQNKVNNYLFQSQEYEFQLPWHFAMYETGDIIDLTDIGLSLVSQLVKITEKDVAQDGCLTFKAQVLDAGAGTPAVHNVPEGQGYVSDLGVDPGNANQPVIFVPPAQLLTTEMEVWAAISGGQYWGGCNIWISETGEDDYKYVGRVIGGSRHGVLTADLPPSALSPDIVNTLSVDLTPSRGVLLSGTEDDARSLNTLCKVGDEYLAYETATLTAQYKYNLTWLVRGVYGSGMLLRPSGSDFVRLDDSLFKYQCSRSDIGKVIYIKLQSFNYYFRQLQSLADLDPYEFTVTSPGDMDMNLVVNLTARNNGVAPNTKLDVAFDSCPMYDTLGDEFDSGALGFTINASIVGLNGLDVGTLAPNSKYYYWAVGNGTSQIVGGVLSLSISSPAMPSGYTYKRLLGVAYTDGSRHLVGFSQVGQEWLYDDVKLLASGSMAEDWTDQDASGLIPPISTRGGFSIQVDNQNLSSRAAFGLRRNGSSASLGQLQGLCPPGSNARADGWCDTDENQVVELYIDEGLDWLLYVTGFYLSI